MRCDFNLAALATLLVIITGSAPRPSAAQTPAQDFIAAMQVQALTAAECDFTGSSASWARLT